MEKKQLKINFILPPAALSGGPLAILEYANRLIDKGHAVTVTTYPTCFWPDNWKGKPFPWFNFKGKVVYKKTSRLEKFLFKIIYSSILSFGGNKAQKKAVGIRDMIDHLIISSFLIGYMPECDLNIATLWTTAFASFFSKKGKPVYFMQHYEEVFLQNDLSSILNKLLVRLTYELPMYKVANSSWLQTKIQEKFNQLVPFSNNAIELSDFNIFPKKSDEDGVIRIITFSHPSMWKGFSDVVAAMEKIKKEYGDKIEWNIFGHVQESFPENNPYCPYKLHKGLPFKELAKLYAISDIAVCASWYESFPLPPMEAMACGTATVTTSDGMEDYAFDRKNALVVKPRDIDALYKSIKELIDNKELREYLATEGRKTATEYDWPKAVDNREKILLDIFDGNVGYNIFEPIGLGFKDAFGIPYEKMPKDINIKDGLIIEYNSKKYLIHNGAKRQFMDASIADSLDVETIQIDALTFERIPVGMPIVTKYDI